MERITTFPPLHFITAFLLILFSSIIGLSLDLHAHGNPGPTEEAENPYLLNLTVIPFNYTLRIRPVLQNGFPGLPLYTAQGEVTIRVESITVGEADTITMHQRNLDIDTEQVQVSRVNTGENLTISSHAFELERDLYTIKLRDSFNFGELLEIRIPYTANISRLDNVGLYLGYYVDPDTNKTRTLASTKLEPYHARKVFPLFDEPRLKAKWKIVVGRVDDGKYHSLSNMEIERIEKDPDYEGWVWDHYQETVLMPSYLVCVIVSDFVNETLTLPESNRRVTAWAPRHYINRGGGSYGVRTASKILTFFERKFKMDYPLRKLDAVALPQFPTGATENFGVVTYKHKNLIWIPGLNNESQRRKVTQVLSHELSHQWFGNIVTCAWWSEIWLNEGFARFLQFWAMEEVIPEFKPKDAFVNDVLQTALRIDQGSSSHPVHNSVKSTKESSAVFDKITYDKGASLLNMIQGFLTKDVFEEGIIDFYLHKKKWKSVRQEDLFEALQQSVNKNDVSYLLPPNKTVADIMVPWTEQLGYPLVKVNVVDKHTISITQEKFGLTRSANTSSTSNSKWWVPISIISQSENNNKDEDERSESEWAPISSFWLPQTISNVKFSSPKLNTEERWIMVNPNATGYYRVLYDEVLTEMIKKQLERDHEAFSSISRSQLFDDYFNSAYAGYVPIRRVLGLTKYLGKEREANVWQTVLWHLKGLTNARSRFGYDEEADEEARELFKDYFMTHIEQALKLIGERQGKEERGINVTLRANLYEMACQLKTEICRSYASELLMEWEREPEINPFPLDLRSVLYCPAMSSASLQPNSTSWNFMLTKFNETRSKSERTLLLKGLTCSENLTDLQSLLDLVLTSNDQFLSSNTEMILAGVVMHPNARPVAYEFMKKALTMKKLSIDTFSDVVKFLIIKSTKPAGKFDELEQFLNDYLQSLEPTEREEQEDDIISLKAFIQSRLHTMQKDE